MTVFTAVATYVVVWCVVLFAVLPFGVRRHRERAPGLDPGAPEKPHLWRKAGATTLVASLVWLAIYITIEAELIPVRPR